VGHHVWDLRLRPGQLCTDSKCLLGRQRHDVGQVTSEAVRGEEEAVVGELEDSVGLDGAHGGVGHHQLHHACLGCQPAAVQEDGTTSHMNQLLDVSHWETAEHLGQRCGILWEFAVDKLSGVVHIHCLHPVLQGLQLVQSHILVVDGLHGVAEGGEVLLVELAHVEAHSEVHLVLQRGAEEEGRWSTSNVLWGQCQHRRPWEGAVGQRPLSVWP